MPLLNDINVIQQPIISIIASAGQGRSTLATYLAKWYASTGDRVIFVSPEGVLTNVSIDGDVVYITNSFVLDDICSEIEAALVGCHRYALIIDRIDLIRVDSPTFGVYEQDREVYASLFEYAYQSKASAFVVTHASASHQLYFPDVILLPRVIRSNEQPYTLDVKMHYDIEKAPDIIAQDVRSGWGFKEYTFEVSALRELLAS